MKTEHQQALDSLYSYTDYSNLASHHFAQAKCDLAVIRVGTGGWADWPRRASKRVPSDGGPRSDEYLGPM